MRSKYQFILFFALLLLIIGGGIFFFKRSEQKKWSGWKTYHHPTLGFSFRYPEKFGDIAVREDEGVEDDDEQSQRGDSLFIQFSSQQQISVSALTPDFEPWEHQIITWKPDEDARAFCVSYLGYWFVLTHTGCDEFRDDIFTVNYAAYSPDGIASDPSSITYERAAFVKLVDKKFAGLEIRMALGEQIDESFATKSEAEIRAIGSEQLVSFMQSRQDRIDQFHQILSSFVVW